MSSSSGSSSSARSNGGDLKTKQIVHALNRVFDDGFVLVNENGGQDLWSYYCPYLKVTEHRGCVAPAEQTVMGLGVAGAIGAKLGRPDTHVVCVTGDGAFQMYMKEIPTAVQYRAPVLWVVCNNASLHWTKWISRATGREVPRRRLRGAARPRRHRTRERRPRRVSSTRRAISSRRSDARSERSRTGTRSCSTAAIDTWDYPKASSTSTARCGA